MSRPHESQLIVTLPVYRDTSSLEKTADALQEITPSISKDFILSIAEDGFNSSEIVERLRTKSLNRGL